MMKHPSTPARARVLAVVAAAIVLIAACGNVNEASPGSDSSSGGPGASSDVATNGSPGVSDTEIHFASFGTGANNPLGTCVSECFDAGIKAYFDWRNSQGGVHGRKLVLSEELDDQVAQNQQRALEIVSANDVFGAFSATLLAAGWKDIAKAGIPLYTWAINFNEMNGQKGIFGDRAALCIDCLDRFFPFAATQAKAKRVGTVGYSVAQASKDCVATIDKTVTKYGGKTGQTVAYKNDGLDFGLANGVAPEVTAMKNAKVDFIVACLDLNGVKTLEQELERQGMGNVTVLQNNTYDSDFIKSGGDLFEGDIVQVSFRPFEASPGKSQLDTYRDWMGKAGQKVTEISMQGWINADIAYQGILAAGPSFTRESVIAATNKMTAFTAGGMIGPIDWSRQHEKWTDADPITHGPALACRSFVRVKNRQFELIGDKDKPFFCFKSDSMDSTEPIPSDFG
jgi:ABC-type branched-subunit amino acid transport system substrate-binding protein